MPIPRARELLPDLWPPLAYALDAATEVDPAKRTIDAGTMAAELERILAGMGPSAEQDARNELKERVKAYIVKAGPVSGSGYRYPPRQGSTPPAAPHGAGRSVPPSSAGATRLAGAGRSAPPPHAAPEPSAARRSAPPGERGLRGNRVAALASPPVHFLDFDGPVDAPVRRHKMTSTPEDELRRMLAAGNGARGAGELPAMVPAGLAGVDDATADDGLSDAQLRRKRRIFFAGLLLLALLATGRLLVASGC
jgi:serine/threonine-protein kinase